MKKIVLLLIAFALNYSIFAQRNQSVVFLKSGSIIHGKVLEQKTDELVKIESRCGDILVFKANEYDSVITQRTQAWNRFKNKQVDTYFFSFTPMLHVNSNDDPFLTFEFVGARRFLGNFSAGIGTGLLIANQILYPIYADTRLYLTKSANSPFIEMKIGRVFSDKTGFDENQVRYRGGLLFGFETGFATRLGKDGLFECKLGYRFQNYTEIQKNSWWNEYITETEYNLNRFSFGLGFTFF